jgi:hypothetical protein
VVSGSPDGVYLRDSTGSIERNTLTRLTSHAVTLVGDTSGTLIEENTFAGRGPSAIDRKRSEGSTVRNNDAGGWESTKPFWTVVRNALQPLTVMWILLGLVVVGTAIKGSRSRTGRRHPYQDQRRLSELIEEPQEPAAPQGRRDLVGAGVGGREDPGVPQ